VGLSSTQENDATISWGSMKRHTRYRIKFVVTDGNYTDKYYREFTKLACLRKFAKKFKEEELLYCWRNVRLGKKKPFKEVGSDREFYKYDYWEDLFKANAV
jgi:hypothetical protein